MNTENKTGTELPMEETDILIVGAGTAGLSAAIYGLRAGCQVRLIESNVHGGQIIYAPKVENYPAIEGISGFDYAQQLYTQAKNLGAQIVYEKIQQVSLKGEMKEVLTNKKRYTARALIIATGAAHRQLGAEGEARFRGRGISFCSTCDGAFFRDMPVMVVGGGNTALSDALFLSKLCPKVYLVHRRDIFRGEKILQEAVLAKENIEILYSSVVEEFLGEKKLSGARIKQAESGAEQELEISGAFIAVGLAPQNQLFAGEVDLDAEGYIAAGEDCSTNLPGVWAAGDARTKELRQLVTAAADGAVSGTAAAAYVNRF